MKEITIEKAIVDTKQKLVNVLNQSGLPLGVIGLILESLSKEVNLQVLAMAQESTRKEEDSSK